VILQYAPYGLFALDLAIMAVGLGAAMWINHRDARRNEGRVEAYLAEVQAARKAERTKREAA
jgi:hypothetical protein